MFGKNPCLSLNTETQWSDGATWPQSYFRYKRLSHFTVSEAKATRYSFNHSHPCRCSAVCSMPITFLCGCASLSFAALVCSSLTWGPWSSVSLTPSCQVRSSLWTTPSSSPWTLSVLWFAVVSHWSHLPKTCFYVQECWFSSWPSLPSSTVGWTLLPRCFALLTGCFTR